MTFLSLHADGFISGGGKLLSNLETWLLMYLTVGDTVSMAQAGPQGHVISIFDKGEVIAITLHFICLFGEQ